MASRLQQLARDTPPSRDRYVDFLRAVSILAVVFGHWVSALIERDEGLIRVTGAVGRASGLWLGTWIFQVIPVFFFVGGFSNLVALDATRAKGGTTWTFVRVRAGRLLRPSLVFLGAWTVVEVVMHLGDLGQPTAPRLWGNFVLLRGVRPPGQTLPFGPLWFLAVYLAVVVISPVTIAAHRRFGAWVPVAMAVCAGLVDVAGFVGGHPKIRYLNIGFVLLFPHQLGHFYGDGTWLRASRRLWWAMVVSGLTGLLLLTNSGLFELFGDRRFRWFPGIGHYPRSLLGTNVERISNAYPPTLCFLLGGVWMVGSAMLLRSAVTRWLARERPWIATIAVNARIMTIFLWHMTAYLMAILILWPLGFGRDREPTVRWWLERPLWLAAAGTVLYAMVVVIGPLERTRRRRTATSEQLPT